MERKSKPHNMDKQAEQTPQKYIRVPSVVFPVSTPSKTPCSIAMSGVKDSGASKMLLISAFERVKNFSFTVLTHLDAEGVFAALPHDAR